MDIGQRIELGCLLRFLFGKIESEVGEIVRSLNFDDEIATQDEVVGCITIEVTAAISTYLPEIISIFKTD